MALSKGANHSHQNKNQRQEHRLKMEAEAEKQNKTNKNRTNKQRGKVEEMGKDEFRGITSRVGDVLKLLHLGTFKVRLGHRESSKTNLGYG